MNTKSPALPLIERKFVLFHGFRAWTVRFADGGGAATTAYSYSLSPEERVALAKRITTALNAVRGVATLELEGMEPLRGNASGPCFAASSGFQGWGIRFRDVDCGAATTAYSFALSAEDRAELARRIAAALNLTRRMTDAQLDQLAEKVEQQRSRAS